MTTQTKAYAVLIGVDDYSTYDPSNKHNLLGCVNDVRAFWDVCVTSGFAPENIHVLTNPPIDPAELGGVPGNFHAASRAGILAERDALVEHLRTDDRAVGLLVYSGHGAWIDDAAASSAIICPADFSMDLGRPNNDIPVNTLWKGAGSNLTVVLDCCHSGGRSRASDHPITPRDPHHKHLPTAPLPHAGGPDATSKLPALKADSINLSALDQGPQKGGDKLAFHPLDGKDLAAAGLMPIGSALPLTLTSRVLTEADMIHSPYRETGHDKGGPRVLAACDVQHAAYQAEFAGRFHGAFTWAVTSTVGQWNVEEAADGAIRTTIGCGAVKRHAARLLQVFAFKQTPVLHPASATDLPFFGVRGPISEDPTGAVITAQVDPEIKVLELALTDDHAIGMLLSRLDIVSATEVWALGNDFVLQLARASAASHSALSFRVTTSPPTPVAPTTLFRMPTRVSWGSATSAPTGSGFYSTSGAGAACLAIFIHLNTGTSPATVTGIDWYQGVVGGVAQPYPLTSPGRQFTFADRLTGAPAGLTWFHARVLPL